jgi:TatD DNase family protein
VPSLPKSRILTETDGPFTRTGDRPAEPADVGSATAALAESLGIDRERAIELVFANLRSLIAA